MKVLVIDEMSMKGRETFEDLDISLRNIKKNLPPFGGMTLLLVGDVLEIPPLNQKGVFMKPSKRLYKSFDGWLWKT